MKEVVQSWVCSVRQYGCKLFGVSKLIGISNVRVRTLNLN